MALNSRIRVLGLGTYYKSGSPNAGPNASPLRGWTYLVKVNRPTPPQPQVVQHPLHPSGEATRLATPAEAYDYSAQVYAAVGREAAMRAIFPGGAPAKIALVPVPSSQAVASRVRDCRWPGREIANRLEAYGFGRVVIALAQTEERISKSNGGPDRSAEEIAAGFMVLEQPRSDETVVYVDDILTWGSTLVAADAVLTPASASGAMVVACTDGSPGLDCYQHRWRELALDRSTSPWQVKVL